MKSILKPHVCRFDIRTVAKCGAHARTTGNPCRAPAMRNGRCKLHGGKSSGPKTSEGRKRISEAQFIHGLFTNESRALTASLWMLRKEIKK